MYDIFHLHKIHLIKSDLDEIYINILLDAFALSMIWVFIPIYLLIFGLSFNQVLIFLMIEMLLSIFFSPIIARISNTVGFKHMLLIRSPLMVLLFVCLSFLSQYPLPVYTLAVLTGLVNITYWIPLNSLFVKNSDKIKRTREVGGMFLSRSIASIIGPTIGGVIALFFGFPILFIIATILILASTGVLFFTKDTKPHVRFNFRKMFSRRHLRFFEGFVVSGSRMAASHYIWPIFIFFVLGSTVAVGFATTITQIGIVIASILMGRIYLKKYSILRLGAVIAAIIWLMRISASTWIEIYSLALIGAVAHMMIEIPFQAFSFDKACEENSDEFIVFREMSLFFGRFLLLFILYFFISKFVIGFSIASLSSLYFLFF